VIDDAQVLGAWAHSHEEDHDDRQTFRPADLPLPPSRGRTTFTLLPDHRAVVGRPGPDDRGTTDDGTWVLDGDVLRVALPTGEAAYEVLAAAADHLELRPIHPSQ
jgi:hypothetical protein